MRLPVICALFTCLFLSAASPLLARSQADGDLNPKAAAELLKHKDVILLDVRTPAEFRSGHIAGARNMNFFGAAFEREAAALPKDSTIVVYCRSGKRSASATEILREAGLKKVHNLGGGLTEWEKAGLPIEKEE